MIRTILRSVILAATLACVPAHAQEPAGAVPRSTVLSNITTSIPNNNQGLITPPIMRQLLTQIANSSVFYSQDLTGPTLLGNVNSGLGMIAAVPLNSTLQFDGSWKLGIDLANANTWTGAQNFSAGIAVGAANSWVNTYLPGSTASEQVEAFITSPNGGYSAIVNASRSSDNSGATQSILTDTCLQVADNTTQADLDWCGYDEGWITATSAYTFFATREISLQNLAAAAPSVDPFTDNPSHVADDLRLSAGVGLGSPNEISTFIHLVNNGTKAKSGIEIGAGALDTTGGFADAVGMGPDQCLCWYGTAGTLTAKILSNTTSGLVQEILGNNTFDLFIGGSGEHPIAIASGLVALNDPVETGGNTYPGMNNSYSSGTSSDRWSNVYSVLGNFSDILTDSATTASTSTTTGAIVDAGGLGVAGAGFFGGAVSATGNFAIGATAGITKTCSALPTAMTITGGIITSITGGTCT